MEIALALVSAVLFALASVLQQKAALGQERSGPASGLLLRMARGPDERGMMGRLPYAAVGSGPPLVVIAGLMPTTGFDGHYIVRATLGPIEKLAATRRPALLNRRSGMAPGLTMADIADEHADAIRAGLSPPVDVIGISTRGSVAQQLAADHPDVVRRLVLVSTACRLSRLGRDDQRRVAARIRAGAPRQALAIEFADVVPTWPGRLATIASTRGRCS